MGRKAVIGRFERWDMCSLCEQRYHGVVACALGWACWKTYVGRPETDACRRGAMAQLANGLAIADALPVREAELSLERRLGASEELILILQGNVSNSYANVGRYEEAMQMQRDVYTGYLKLLGEEHASTLRSAHNYASSLATCNCFEETKSLLRKTMPVARRVIGENVELSLKMRWTFAKTLYVNDSAKLDDIREAVTTLEDVERRARRVFGGAHPLTTAIGRDLRRVQAALRAREAPSTR